MVWVAHCHSSGSPVILAAPSPLEFENPINIKEIPPEGQSCPKPESPDFHFSLR